MVVGRITNRFLLLGLASLLAACGGSTTEADPMYEAGPQLCIKHPRACDPQGQPLIPNKPLRRTDPTPYVTCFLTRYRSRWPKQGGERVRVCVDQSSGFEVTCTYGSTRSRSPDWPTVCDVAYLASDQWWYEYGAR